MHSKTADILYFNVLLVKQIILQTLRYKCKHCKK